MTFDNLTSLFLDGLDGNQSLSGLLSSPGFTNGLESSDSVTLNPVLTDGTTSDVFRPDDWAFHITFEFVTHGILLCLIGSLGLLGNIVSIVILSRPQMKSSINTILIGLVSCDSLLIVTSIFLFSFTVFRHTPSELFSGYYWEVYPYILPIVYPIGLMAQTGSCYMTLGVTIERYLVVCWPLKARSVCTNGRAKLAVFAFFTFAVIYNIPRFLEVTWRTAFIAEFGENKTVFVATELRKNPVYISIYVTWMYLVFMYIIPFASLAVLNLSIFLAIRKANATRAMLSNQEKKEHNLAVMLLVVVLIFFICNILPLIVNILELFGIQNQQLIQVSNLLVTINSSVNILIYCIFGNKFKTLFMQIFCGQKPHIQTVRTGLELRRSQFENSFTCRTNEISQKDCGVGGGNNLRRHHSTAGNYRLGDGGGGAAGNGNGRAANGTHRVTGGSLVTNGSTTTSTTGLISVALSSPTKDNLSASFNLELAEFSDSCCDQGSVVSASAARRQQLRGNKSGYCRRML